jgi:hypothetical protein
MLKVTIRVPGFKGRTTDFRSGSKPRTLAASIDRTMQDKTILYQAQVDRFSQRLVKVFYPYVIIPLLFLFIPFFSKNPDNPVTIVVVIIMLLIIIDMLVSSYKWTFNQVASLTLYDNFFEIEIVTKNTTSVYKIDKDNVRTTLQWKNRRIKILKLSLFDNDHKIADFYSGGKKKMEYTLEEIAYKINKNKTPAYNTRWLMHNYVFKTKIFSSGVIRRNWRRKF